MASFSSEKPKSCRIFSNAAFQKRMDHPPSKMALFVGHELSRGRDNKPHLKFHIKTPMLCIYRTMPRMLGLSG
jgi:hypothetical protein